MRRGKPRASEIVGRLVELGTARLVEDLATPTDSARVVMREIAHSLCQEFGGGEYYMPKDVELQLDKRDVEIWREFDGRNQYWLAVKHSLTERQIRYILAVMRKRATQLNQHELPGFEGPADSA